MKHVKFSSVPGIIEFNPLVNYPEINHFFTTRQSGNMGLHVVNSRDDLAGVIGNREKVCQSRGVDLNRLTTAQQVHGDNVLFVNPALSGRGASIYDESLPDCDGLLTNYRNLPLAIFVADCLPLYIYDKKNKAIGLIHAGRKGTLLGITGKTMEKMKKRYNTDPGQCLAFLGPAIGGCCFEVDLYKLNKEQLGSAGLMPGNIYSVDTCTSCQNDVFYSYRREKEKAGRMMAVLMLK